MLYEVTHSHAVWCHTSRFLIACIWRNWGQKQLGAKGQELLFGDNENLEKCVVLWIDCEFMNLLKTIKVHNSTSKCKEEWNSTIYRKKKMDPTGGHEVEWNKAYTERQTLCVLPYMWEKELPVCVSVALNIALWNFHSSVKPIVKNAICL